MIDKNMNSIAISYLLIAQLTSAASALLMPYSGTENENAATDSPPLAATVVPVPLATIPVATGFVNPVFVTHAPDDYTRLFVVEQGGRVRILNLKTGAVNPLSFLNISGIILSGGERGLLSIAFHPDYQSNGFLFINYTNLSGTSIIARYERAVGNPDAADIASGVILLSISQPYQNHNGGQLQFGPDGFLYIGMGDGGSGGDPNCYAQRFDDPQTHFLGKMLRIDINQNINTPPYYGIPGDNPFGGINQPPAEVWAMGLRNPWRFSFDRLNGDLYIGDVGQAAREEINYQAVDSLGGDNYGWKVMEGKLCFDPDPLDPDCLAGTPSCFDPGFTDPVHEYAHTLGCAVVGGYVYRGCAIPSLSGHYFFGDYCSSNIWSFTVSGGVLSNFVDRSTELAPTGATLDNINSFGEDAKGEIYIVDQDGDIFKIVPQTPLIKDADIDCRGAVNVTDLLALLASWGPCDGCIADFNGDHSVNVTDLLILLASWG